MLTNLNVIMLWPFIPTNAREFGFLIGGFKNFKFA